MPYSYANVFEYGVYFRHMVQGCFGPVNVFRKWYGIHLYIRLNVFGDGYTKIKTFVFILY